MRTKVRTRFAPSPTGSLHIGSLRTALFSYALAKHSQGEFILRIEDTDKKREVPGSTEKIKNLLTEFDLRWDEFYVQSERVKQGVYQKYAKKLVKDGNAFYCRCQPKDAKKDGYSQKLRDVCRDKNFSQGAIKLRVPDNEKVSFVDYVHNKRISWDTATIADTTLLKSDGFPTYHLAVCVDDYEMKVTHALRGHDWLPSTPIHLLIYQYLDLKIPEIGHLTDILDPAGGKLSKRKGSVTVEAMLSEGYLPEAILNFVMLLGWAPKDEREIFSLPAFVKVFDRDGFQKANPVFNRKKLNWLNGVYIRQLSDEEFTKKIKPFALKKATDEKLLKVAPLVKNRLKKLSEFNNLAGFIFEEKEPARAISIPSEVYLVHLSDAVQSLSGVSNWNQNSINRVLSEMISDHNFKTGDFYMDLRTTVSGSRTTPPINESIQIMGKEETLKRLERGLSFQKKGKLKILKE